MKASPGARSWIAAGVRHELLIRSLPALRHHMLAPVSVARMALLLLRRQVAAPQPDAAACAERIDVVDAQVSSLVEGIRSLRDWELAMQGDPLDRATLVAQCVGLLRTPLEMAGVALEIDPALQPPNPGGPQFGGAPALRYLLLGAICHLQDSTPGLQALRVEADGDDRLCVRARAGGEARGGNVPLPEAEPLRAPRRLAIDAVALLTLGEDLGYSVVIEPDAVRFALPPP